jgi:hypothetical protein
LLGGEVLGLPVANKDRISNGASRARALGWGEMPTEEVPAGDEVHAFCVDNENLACVDEWKVRRSVPYRHRVVRRSKLDHLWANGPPAMAFRTCITTSPWVAASDPAASESLDKSLGAKHLTRFVGPDPRASRPNVHWGESREKAVAATERIRKCRIGFSARRVAASGKPIDAAKQFRFCR